MSARKDAYAYPRASGGASAYGTVVYRTDGTPVANLGAFVANIKDYRGGLYTKDGQEIRNPKGFLEGLEQLGRPVLYTEDGTPVRNPQAFVERIKSYDGGLYTSDGQEVKNPKAFLRSLDDTGPPLLYKADGTPVRNAESFVEKINSYEGGLYTWDGKEIKNPKAFVESARSRAKGSRGDGQKEWAEKSEWDAPAKRQGGKGSGGGGGSSSNPAIFKADGSPIYNAGAFVDKISEYNGGLYTSDGQEIWDPKAFVKGMDRKREGGASDGAYNGYQDSNARWPSEGEERILMYKKDGTAIKNPWSYVEKIQEYAGGLFTPDWQEIWNPQAYLDGIEKKRAGGSGRTR